MSAAFVERAVEGTGVRLLAVEAGDRNGPSVLFVHGYPDTHGVWQPVMERLSARYHVMAYDVRGAGASSAPRGLDGYDLERLVDDALAVTAALAPGRRVHLVGHDWGSVQGWEFVSNPRSADRWASFTSISGPSLDYLGARWRETLSRPDPGRWLGLADQALRSWYVGALHVPGLSEALWDTARWWRPLAAHALGEGGPAEPAEVLRRNGVNGSGLYRQNVLRHLMAPRTEAVSRVPVQLVVPTADPFLAQATYDGLAAWAPSLLRRDIEAGHWVPSTHPALLADWIAAFVDSLERGAA